MTQNNRNTGLDLLKIFCMLGISIMHLFGRVFMNANISQFNLYVGVSLNSIFNACVSCFMLISGYYGLTNKKEKIIKLWCCVFFMTIISRGGQYILGEIGGKDLVLCVAPIATKANWFFTCYFVISFLSPIVELLLDEKRTRNYAIYLVCVLVIFFYILPSVFYFEIMDDRGKGVINLLTVYIIGRLISKYEDRFVYRLNKCLIGCIASFMVITLLNCAITYFAGTFKNPFARDNSIFILFESIALFMMFKNCRKIDNRIINKIVKKISKASAAYFILDGVLIALYMRQINLSTMVGSVYLFPLIIILSFLSIVVSYCVNCIYVLIFQNAFLILVTRIVNKTQQLCGKVVLKLKSVE